MTVSLSGKQAADGQHWLIPAALVFVMLFCGACLTLNKKLQYQTLAVGINADLGEHAFQKPWFCTCCMFVGEAMGLLVFGVKKMIAPEEKTCQLSWFAVIWRCTVPAVLDLTASGLAGVGLLYITASSFQMLRGWSILFTAILSRFWLKKEFNFDMVFGLGLILAAMGLIGYAGAVTGGQSSATQSSSSSLLGAGAFGVALVAFAQLFQACQFVWEEKVMKHVFIPPLLLLGVEGVVGIVVYCTFVFPLLMYLPGSDVGGTQENIWDSLAMIQNSSTLVSLFVVYLLCVSTLNCCGVYITKFLSGVHRTLVQTGLRTMFIWGVGLALFYHTEGTYGEPWSGISSYMELIGFVFFLAGSMLYSKMIQLPAWPAAKTEYVQYKTLPAGP